MTAARGSHLADVVSRTRYVLLDFDGPICSIFAHVTNRSVAEQLRGLVVAEGVDLPSEILSEDDPLEVLRFSSGLGQDLAEQVESALRLAELRASACAEPTPSADEVLLACRETQRPVAVVSNNSKEAVESYLKRRRFIEHISCVAGRTDPHPNLLKPSPHLVLEAVHALGADPGASVLVGDSTGDIVSALAAKVQSIGFGNKPGKDTALLEAGADAIIVTMAELAAALRNNG